MRRVHDILHTSGGFADPAGRSVKKTFRLHIAFIQHGNAEEGYKYENICPYCAETLEMVTVNPAAEMERVANRLLQGVVRHYRFCVHRGTGKLQVEKTDAPLNTSKLIREM